MLQCALLIVPLLVADADGSGIRRVGDETNLVRLKTIPETFLEKPICIVGGVEIKRDYSGYYANRDNSYFSLRFTEFGKEWGTRTGEEVNLYLLKSEGAPIMAAILAAQERWAAEGKSSTLHRARVKAVLRRRSYSSGGYSSMWSNLEVMDVQFWDFERQDWTAWILESFAKEKQRAVDDKRLKRSRTVDGGVSPQRTAPPKQAQAVRELRTWTTNDGKFSVEARFVSILGGNVTIERRDGTTVTVPLDRLSGQDHEYIQQLRGGS